MASEGVRRIKTFQEWQELAKKAPRRWMIYGIEDKPESLIEAIFLGIQQYLIMFGATVAVPLIVSSAIAATYQIPDETIRLVQAHLITITFFAAGITTLLQTWHVTGSGLPIIQGSSFSFLGPVLSIVGAGSIIARAEGFDSLEAFIAGTDPYVRAATVLQYIGGAILAASLFEIILGYSGLMGLVKRVITPVSIGPTILLIGLTLFGAPGSVGVPACAWEAFLVVVLIVIFNQIIGKKFVKVQMFSILISIVLAWLVAVGLFFAGAIAPGSACAVNLWTIEYMVKTGYYVRPPIPFPWGPPKFVPAFIVGMIAAYLASMVESIGDYHSVARMSEAPPPAESMISKGLGAEGLGCAIGAIFGATGGFTSYSENIGAIGLTRVASRYVFQLGGVIILFLGGILFVWGAFMATMPGPVVGGMYLAVFGLIAAVGISLMSLADLKSSRNLFIIGLASFAGLAVPNMMGLPGVADGIRAAFAGMGLLGETIANIVIIIGNTGMAVGAIIAIILDNLIPGTPEERGIAHPEWAA